MRKLLNELSPELRNRAARKATWSWGFFDEKSCR